MTNASASLSSTIGSKNDSSAQHAQVLVEGFKKTTRFYVWFHLLFAALAFAELFSLAVFFSFWIASSTIAFLLAGIFLTGFSYFVLLFYFQVKKPQQLLEIRQVFLHAMRQTLSSTRDLSTYRLSVIHEIYRATDALDRVECDYYRIPIPWTYKGYL